jgi:enoyl-CoA hydratase/carnithine racemase
MVDTPTSQGAAVLREDDGHVRRLTLHRPSSRNALSTSMLRALAEELCAADASADVHVVVLAGEGPAFSAGHDLKELRDHPDPQWRAELFEQCSELMVQVTRLRQPVIAEVATVATAAGCQLVATCDLAVAAESARFATPGVNIGLFCTTPMVALSRAVAPKHAMEMLLTGEMVDAAEAHRIGLVNRVVPDARLRVTTDQLAATIAAKSPLVVSLGKQAFQRSRDLPLREAYLDANSVMVDNLTADDAGEGIAAFLERRPATWTGR